MKQINNLNEALELLNTNILIASNYNIKRIFFMKSNNKILVINENIKCYITVQEFINDFLNYKFYLYKNLEDIDIDQEIRLLRQ